MKREPRVAVVVLGYNHRQYLATSLQATLGQTYHNYSVYYVDNASHDDSCRYVEKTFTEIVTVKNDVNFGYAKAYNLIMTTLFSDGYDAVVALNPDTIVAKNFLQELVQTAYMSDAIGIAQSKIYLLKDGKKSDVVDSAGNKVHYAGFGYCDGHGKNDGGFGEDVEIAAASGAAMLIKKEAFQKVGGFDEMFFAYLEDQDLCWRMRMCGYNIMLSSASHVWHDHQFIKKEASSRKFYLLERNRWIFLVKNYECRTLMVLSPILVFLEVSVFWHALVHHYLLEKMRGYYAVMKHAHSILCKRRVMQAKRTKNDKVLAQYFVFHINLYGRHSFMERVINSILQWYGNVIFQKEKSHHNM